MVTVDVFMFLLLKANIILNHQPPRVKSIQLPEREGEVEHEWNRTLNLHPSPVVTQPLSSEKRLFIHFLHKLFAIFATKKKKKK